MNLKKLQQLGDKYGNKFKELATAIVNDEVITDEDNKKTIIMLSARDMAIGAAFKKSEYILTGVGIGVVGTALAFTIGCKIKNRNKEEVLDINTVEELLKDSKKRQEEIKEAMEAFEEVSVSQPEVTETNEENQEYSDEQIEDEKQVNNNINIMDKVNDILKKPQNLDDLKAVIEELKKNEK